MKNAVPSKVRAGDTPPSSFSSYVVTQCAGGGTSLLTGPPTSAQEGPVVPCGERAGVKKLPSDRTYSAAGRGFTVNKPIIYTLSKMSSNRNTHKIRLYINQLTKM